MALEAISDVFVIDGVLNDRRYALVFFSRSVPGAMRIRDKLRRYFDKRIPPDGLFFLAAEGLRSVVEERASDAELLASLPDFTRMSDRPDIAAVTYDANGTLQTTEESADVIEYLLSLGQQRIFLDRGGMLYSSPAFHYVKPSGRHADRFIRTGNVLMYGTEVDFLALGVLPYLKGDEERIYTDTASINSLALSAVRMRLSMEPDWIPPIVESFSSYWGLGQPLEQATRALCLISASTSGGLVADIDEEFEIPPDRTLTVFYCGRSAIESPVLCNLTGADKGSEVPYVRNFDKEDCALCDKGSRPIRILHDTFLPAEPAVEPVLFTTDSVPKWIETEMSRLVGREAIRCNQGVSGTSGQVRQLFLDMTKILDEHSNSLTERLRRVMQAHLPASTGSIVHLNDPASKQMADIAEAFLGNAGITPKRLSAEELFDRRGDGLGHGAVVVVASTIVSGRTLLSISQHLRLLSPDQPLIYVILSARMSDESIWREVLSNLSFGREAREHRVLAVSKAWLPDERIAGPSPWTLELRTLHELKRMAREQGLTGVVEELDARMSVLSKKDGLLNECYWPSLESGDVSFVASREPLRLSENFAFWDFEYDANVITQADVHATIAGLMHAARTDPGVSTVLYDYVHSVTLLSPTNFVRFNDGVVQAAILRCAKPAELDYTADVSLSEQMLEILKFLFGRIDTRTGEACAEFVLSIAQDRLRLHATHINELAALLRQTTAGNLKWMCEQSVEGQEAPEHRAS